MTRPGLKVLGTVVCLPVLLMLCGFTWPWNADGPWPSTSNTPVTILTHPVIEDLDVNWNDGYSFAAFGDQRALGDGEWQEIVKHIAEMSAADPDLRFVVDTGDIVDTGRHSDQWSFLADILSPLAHLPYLPALGNHELGNNDDPVARRHTATFLAYLDPGFGEERLYYRKDPGPVRFLFLDTNDFVYGENGEGTTGQPVPGGRAEAQLLWLTEQLADDDEAVATVVVMHHPLVQSSRKHIKDGAAIWSFNWRGRSLPDILADGGVDVILTGNTHTYERFQLIRNDGREMALVNLSGRPRDNFLWIGKGQRKARDIAGRETGYLTEHGWRDLAGWRIEQRDAMLKGHKNNFGIFRVDEAGNIDLAMHYLDEDTPSGLRSAPVVRLYEHPRQRH